MMRKAKRTKNVKKERNLEHHILFTMGHGVRYFLRSEMKLSFLDELQILKLELPACHDGLII